MYARSSLNKGLRVFAGATAALPPAGAVLVLLTCGLPFAEATPISPGPAEGPQILAAAEDTIAIGHALQLLSRRPETVAVIDPYDATPEGQKILAKAEAFVVKGVRIVYVNRQGEVLKGAREGYPIYVHMLACIIWHEMAHIDGADEREAQRQEEALWKRFLVEGRLDRATALRYLKLMSDRHQ
jgi:hypothetical protein